MTIGDFLKTDCFIFFGKKDEFVLMAVEHFLEFKIWGTRNDLQLEREEEIIYR